MAQPRRPIGHAENERPLPPHILPFEGPDSHALSQSCQVYQTPSPLPRPVLSNELSPQEGPSTVQATPPSGPRPVHLGMRQPLPHLDPGIFSPHAI